MTIALKNEKKTRAYYRHWIEDESQENFFRDTITLDPVEVARAWDRLGRDTFGLTIALYPRILHQALIATLKGGGQHDK